ncbi:MAG: SagB family peptide dehydrogenase, partial [Thermodesulfobacteriota bacterium]
MSPSNPPAVLNSGEYHHQTGYSRNQMTGGNLDWANQPSPVKTYPHAEAVPLARNILFPEVSLWELGFGEEQTGHGKISPGNLSAILYLAYGVTASRKSPGGEFFYRSAPSAGALYPAEIYSDLKEMEGIPSGVYHYDSLRHSLTSIRINAPQFEERMESVLYISGIFIRSAWKYRNRAYRYILLDCGHLLENLLLAFDAFSIICTAGLAFNDRWIENRLELDETREGVLAFVRISKSENSAGRNPYRFEIPSSEFKKPIPLRPEITYPMVLGIHRAGYDWSPDIHPPVSMEETIGVSVSRWEKIRISDKTADPLSFSEAVRQRRSRRNFISRSLAHDRFLDLLEIVIRTWRRKNIDEKRWISSICTGFIVNSVEGVSPGFYLLDPVQNAFGPVFGGSDSKKIASICLDQEWLSNASIYILL